MKIDPNKLDAEDMEIRDFVKFKSKKHKLKGRQTVTQLVSRGENNWGHPSKFENADLNTLSKMGLLDELISGIKNGISLLMEFIGDENGTPAARISDLKMDRDEADEAFRQAVQNLKLIVGSGRVHGDYSAFNILWQGHKAVVIDFPQVIEFKNNPNAYAFLERDVHALCKSFIKQGVRADEANVLREVRAR